ncbi:MAG: class I SAM-dependent methyltransferase [Candidatus Acidiferrum sp.]
MPGDRTRARELAAEFIRRGDPAGWFEALYKEGEEGKSVVPWADGQKNAHLAEFWRAHAQQTAGRNALVIGCGLGDDAQQLAEWGYQTTAFDISETAIRTAKNRFPKNAVEYRVANLLQPPAEWTHSFDFVLEVYTLQALPPNVRSRALQNVASFVRPGGNLLVLARGREPHEPEGQLPWPLTRAELADFGRAGLSEQIFEDYFDNEEPPARRYRVLYSRPTR